MPRLLLVLAVLAAGVQAARAGEVGVPDGLFPFVLPWDDASSGVTDLSGWLRGPAGASGAVRAGSDGHLYAGGERIRFFGVDLAFSANLPREEDAPRLAARLARFGVNIVRFHILDMRRFPDGLLAREGKDSRALDPEALDRLDAFTEALNRKGTYVYLCLLNYRRFTAADGLPPEIEQAGSVLQRQHVAGFFFEPLIALQKEYARALLTHRNPRSGFTYADSPGVAFVEINNENGLIHAWLRDEVDALPDVFLAVLRQQWNGWLRARHGSSDALRQAWGATAEGLGEEMLTNSDFAHGTDGWALERHGVAEATVVADREVPPAPPGGQSVRLTVTRPGTESWHVRFEQTGKSLEAGRSYTFSFWARADQPCTARVSTEQGHEPWQNVGLVATVALTPEWQAFRFVVPMRLTDTAARVIFDPGLRAGEYWLAGASFRLGGVNGLGDGEQLETGSVATLRHVRAGERTLQAQQDWLAFLWDTEDAYWQGLYRFLKDDLGVKALVIGTVVGCSTPNLMARLDSVDTHAYWCHPSFPGRPWDPENWVVSNRSMVNDRGGTLPGLALHRVLGKPHCVTEYGHAAPNPHAGEGDLLRDAYAALQDWDYVSTSRYSHDTNWDLRRIRNYFDIDQHPTRMVTLIPAAAMFLRGDVACARLVVVAVLGREAELAALGRARAWELVGAGDVGVPRQAALVHRVAIATEGQPLPPGALTPAEATLAGDRIASDTGELLWDLSDPGRGVVTVNTARSKAVIGFGAGKRYDLGGVVIEPGPTCQEGWSAITLTALTGDPLRPSCRMLVTATGYVQNTNMGWKTPEKTSVGRQWGEAPTLVEGVPGRITLPVPAAAVKAWALDERGQRRTPVAVQPGDGGRALVAIGPEHRTLWYEIQAD